MPDLVAFSPDEDVSGVEYELTQHLHKRQFAEMTVVGQFNKGFIIALLDKHLFIIDQHASDEKYMYEMYTRNSIVQAQKLFRFGEKCLRLKTSLFLLQPHSAITFIAVRVSVTCTCVNICTQWIRISIQR
jgi:DNA mismatch repair ATPase MutL